VAFVFLFSLAKQGKKRGKNPHSEAVKKGQKEKKQIRHRRIKKGAKKIQVASPHLLIFFFFYVFRVQIFHF
jgi:hypothetical protein